ETQLRAASTYSDDETGAPRFVDRIGKLGRRIAGAALRERRIELAPARGGDTEDSGAHWTQTGEARPEQVGDNIRTRLMRRFRLLAVAVAGATPTFAQQKWVPLGAGQDRGLRARRDPPAEMLQIVDGFRLRERCE